MDPKSQVAEEAKDCQGTNSSLYSITKDQLFKPPRDDDNEVLYNRNTDSTRNSIGNLHMLKRLLKEPQTDSRIQQVSKQSDKHLTKKLDNMIDLISRQLQKECKMSFDVDEDSMYDKEYVVRCVVRLQSFFRMLPLRRQYRQKRKWAEYRKHVIFELYDTEVRYVEDLKLIITLVMTPLRQMQILDEDQLRKLFNNIESICWLNEDFLKALEGKKTHYYHYQLIGDIAVKFVHFFKIYYDYFTNFSVDCVDQMRKDPSLKSLDDFISVREPPIGNLFRGLNLQSFLVKPVQRLPKYVLLFKDLLKHTESDHPDYMNLTKALESFKQVMHNINNKINKQVQSLKMFELQKLFGDSNGISILHSTREFLAEETLTIVHQQKERSVIVYFMNDLVLVTERVLRQERLYKQIFLDENSFCKNLPDYKHFSDIFTLIGKSKSITFVCGNKENKSKIMSLLVQLIDDLKMKVESRTVQHFEQTPTQKKFYNIKVHTIATEEQESLLSKFTVYIVEVIIGLAKLKIFVRYREIVELQQMVRRDFPTMDLPNLSTFNWFNNHKTKVIEARKIQIENFLQTLLSTKQVYSNPEKWLKFLSLPLHFYQLGEIDQSQVDDLSPLDIIGQTEASKPKPSIRRGVPSDKRIVLNLEPVNRSTMLQQDRYQFILNSHSTLSSQCLQNGNYSIVSASELFRCSRGGPASKLSRGSYQTGFSNQSMPDWKFKLPEVIEEVQIYLMDDRVVRMEISDQSRSGDIIEMVAHEVQLQAFLDFKLVICDNHKRTIRVLDDDEILIKVYQRYSKSSTNLKEQGILDGFFNRLSNYFTTKDKNHITIYLKKVLYLPNIQEQEDYKNDHVRLRLLCHQVFAEIKNDNYYLGFNELCLYTAMFLYIRHQELQAKVYLPHSIKALFQLYQPSSFPHEKLREILPLRILRSVKERVWADSIFTFLKRIRQEIKGLWKEKLEVLKMREEEKIDLNEFDKVYMCELLFIRQIGLNNMYGVAKFNVQVTKQTQMDVKKKLGLSLPQNVVLGISFVYLWIISPQTQSPLHRLQIIRLNNLQYYTGNISFQVDEQDDLVFRFNTSQVFEIQRLLREYDDVRMLEIECQSSAEDSGQKEYCKFQD